MAEFELAQLNVAVMREPLESPGMADFVGNLERINAFAETSAGFVWRLQTEDGDATALRPFGEKMLVNISVWEDTAALRDFVYRSAHVQIMRRRSEWFEQMAEAYLVLWWVARGHRPTVTEAKTRLDTLRERGPTRDAFNFARAFAAPDAPEATTPPPVPGRSPAG